MSNSQRIVFDIETAPLCEAGEYLEPVEAPSNYRDPLKIDAYIKAGAAEQLSKCALDVDLCRVVAIGWQVEGQASGEMLASHDASEREMLRAFWSLASHRHLIGFNCLGFDLPVLLRRSLYLRVERPALQIDKYRHPQVTDLLSELSFDGKLRLRGLSFYCKRFGIDVATEDGLTGAQIGQAVADGRWDEVKQHVRADMEKTAALAARMGLFAPLLAESAVL